jgi:hypothetical protein
VTLFKWRALALAGLCLTLAGCQRAPNSVIGTWLVKIPDAPFPLHMFTFHSDGTVLQSNPDAGDPSTSDSNAMGAWTPDGDGIKGKIVEITADRSTRQFVSRGEISFTLKVSGDAFTGTASASFYDSEGRHLRGPLAVKLDGQRMLP